MPQARTKPLRLLVVCPSWVGDAIMATPALRRLRDSLRGSFIGALVRPGIDEILAGTSLFDDVIVERSVGVMGPKRVASRVRPARYDTALLLTNSFSSALISRLAGVPRRVGYDRDGRALLLTDRTQAPRRPDGSWAPIPAVNYYWNLASFLLEGAPADTRSPADLPPGTRLELAASAADDECAAALLSRAGIDPLGPPPLAILNPGGNNPLKRWPPDRFAHVADHLAHHRGMRVLVNGSPAEADLVRAIASTARTPVANLPELGVTLGTLKALVRRASLMVTNDTGPRHVAAAFGVPLVSLFGPTDHRWTLIPTLPGTPEELVLADPTLGADELANDDPERSRIDRISTDRVIEAIGRVLDAARPGPQGTRTGPLP